MKWWPVARPMVARLRISAAGSVVAGLSVCLSLTPSLLPRTWQAQGIISGVSAALGYGLGVALAWLWHRSATLTRLRVPHRWRWPARGGVGLTVAGLLGLSLYYGSLWQRGLHTLLGEPPPPQLGYVRVLLVTVLVLAIAVGVVRALTALARWPARLARDVVPRMPATIIGTMTVALIGLVAGEAVVHNGFLTMMSSMSEATNNATDGVVPRLPTRSGSPHSLVSWDSLGREGRTFVSGGPTVEELRAFGAAPAKEPIRVYVGLQSSPDPTAAAELAVRELVRTNAGARAVLCVVTTTGTGWVDPYAAAALEYLVGGDSAIVGTQFSYLPSWVSFLTERERATQAGRVLFESVYAYWSALPPGHRPRLLVFGESLGSLGSEAAFTGLDDLRQRTDGALWIGPTNANPLWRTLVTRRDNGSPEVLPVYGGGETVRFASRPEDLDVPTGPWPPPRVVYLQNPSDPVTWWSPALLLTRPDWLEEPRGYDVQPAVRWYPVLTFLQVTADLALAQRAPSTHGHYFHGATVAAWAAIVAPPGWTEDRSAALTRRLDQL